VSSADRGTLRGSDPASAGVGRPAPRERIGEEGGFVFRTIIVLVLVLGVIAIATLDTVSILTTRYRVSDVADKASFEAADVYKRTRDARQACEVAADYVRQNVEGAAVAGKKACAVDPTTGEVTITVHATANTLAAKRLSFLEGLTKAVGKSSSPAPP